MARHRDRLFHHLHAGRAALPHSARTVPAPFADVGDVPQQCQPDRAAGARHGAHSCSATASAAPACTGTPRPGASCRPTSRCAVAPDAALWREFPARGHDDPGLGRHLSTISSRITTSSNICAAPPARPAISRAPSRTAAIRSRARARGPIRRRRRSRPTATRCSPKAAKELGYKPFPQPSGNLSQAYTNPLGVTMGHAPIAASASGSAAPIIPKRRRRRRCCRCCCANRISRRAPNAKSPASISTAPASAPPASLMSTRPAKNSSSRPISCCCARSRCSTCNCCCCPASVRPTTRKPARVRSDAISPTRRCRTRSAFSTRTNTTSIHSSRPARSA